MPTKTSVKINLKNFTPFQEEDFFRVSVLYPYGFIDEKRNYEFLDSKYRTGGHSVDAHNAKDLNSTFDNVYVAENVNNVIRINKRKDGLYSSEDFKIFVPKNNQIELNFEY